MNRKTPSRATKAIFLPRFLISASPCRCRPLDQTLDLPNLRVHKTKFSGSQPPVDRRRSVDIELEKSILTIARSVANVTPDQVRSRNFALNLTAAGRPQSLRPRKLFPSRLYLGTRRLPLRLIKRVLKPTISRLKTTRSMSRWVYFCFYRAAGVKLRSLHE